MSRKARRDVGVDLVQRDPALLQPEHEMLEGVPVGIGGRRLEALGRHRLRERFRQADEEPLQGRVEIAKNRASRIPDIDEDSLRSCFHTGPGPTLAVTQS